jgi:hypothetical protein
MGDAVLNEVLDGHTADVLCSSHFKELQRLCRLAGARIYNLT